MTWQAVGHFQVSAEPIYTPATQGRIFRVRSLDYQRFQVLIRQAQVIFEQVELWGSQRLSVGPEFQILILEQPLFFQSRRLSIQLSDLAVSLTRKNVLVEVSTTYE